MVRILFLLFSFLLGTALSGQRGLWIVRNSLNTQQDINLLKQIDQSVGLTDVYFQVRALGKNMLPEKNDNSGVSLKDVISFCRQNNIRFHAWINAFYIWTLDSNPDDDDHSVLWDRDHLMTDARAKIKTSEDLKQLGIEGYFVDPDADVNIRQIKKLIKSLIKEYQVQGIHFDYFRYPASPVHYSKYLRTKFLRNYFLDPAQMQIHNKEYFSCFRNTSYQYMNQQYDLFLQNELSNRLMNFTAFIKQLNRNCTISVAVKPNASIAENQYGQNWLSWLKQNECDYVVLMNYTPDNIEFKKNLNMAKSLKQVARLVVGIGAYYLNKFQLQERLAEVEQMGFSGYCLFSFTTLKKEPALISMISANSFSKDKVQR